MPLIDVASDVLLSAVLGVAGTAVALALLTFSLRRLLRWTGRRRRRNEGRRRRQMLQVWDRSKYRSRRPHEHRRQRKDV